PSTTTASPPSPTRPSARRSSKRSGPPTRPASTCSASLPRTSSRRSSPSPAYATTSSPASMHTPAVPPRRRSAATACTPSRKEPLPHEARRVVLQDAPRGDGGRRPAGGGRRLRRRVDDRDDQRCLHLPGAGGAG